MAEVKNESKNEVKEKDIVSSIANVEKSNDENIGFVDVFAGLREREESGDVVEGNTKTYKTNVVIQHHNSNGYDNYGIGFAVTVNGNVVPQILNLIPSERRKVLYETLAAIMNIPGQHFLEVVRNTIRNNQTNAVTHTYSMQVSCETDDGFLLTCPLRPQSRCDTAVWENLKKMLISKGVIE